MKFKILSTVALALATVPLALGSAAFAVPEGPDSSQSSDTSVADVPQSEDLTSEADQSQSGPTAAPEKETAQSAEPTPTSSVNLANPLPTAEIMPAATTIASGSWNGTAWAVDSDGKLTIGAGTLGAAASASAIPWASVASQITTAEFTAPATTYLNADSSYLFANLPNLTSITNIGLVNTSNVTKMPQMFYGDTSLTSLDLHQWDMSQVSSLGSMFQGATGLTSLNVAWSNTSNFNTLGSMFSNVSKVASLDLSTWNISNVSSISYLFNGMASLTDLTLGAGWNTSNVTNMSGVFQGASKLTSLDLHTWNTAKVTNLSYFFNNMIALTSVNTTGWNTSAVTNLTAVFQGTTSLTSVDVSHWNTSNVTVMSSLFGGSGLTSLDLSTWDTTAAYAANNMGQFFNSSVLKSLTLGPQTRLATNVNVVVSTTGGYTGSWVQVGAGTTTIPQGPWIGSSADLYGISGSAAGTGQFIWQRSVTVAFNSNQGTGSIASLTGGTGQALTLPSGAALSRAGYNFTGWNTQADGQGTPYTSGQASLYFAGGAVTLFAQWDAAPATITFDGNGGTGTMAPLVGVTGQVVNVTANTFTNPGYTFSGWDSVPSGGGVSVSAGGSVTLPANGLTLYAQWVPNGSVAITYAANASQVGGGMANTEVLSGQPATVATNAYTRSGFSFVEWNTQADGQGTSYAENEVIPTLGSNLTLYAVWEALPAALTFVGNGGSGTIASITGVTAQSVTVPVNSFTHDGFTFTGWDTAADGSGVSYQPGDTVALPAGGLTLYAIWDADEATIVFEGNGNDDGSTPPVGDVTNGQLTIPPNGFTRDGFTFTGWNTQADGQGTTYQPGDTITLPPGGLSLYATWDADESVMSFAGNGANAGSVAPITGVTDGSVTVPANGFTRMGFTFTGWNTQANGQGTAYQPGDTATLPAGGVTLYAIWESQAAILLFAGNGGSGSTSPINGTTGDLVILPGNDFTRTGFAFTGWNTQADGQGTTHQPGTTLTLPPGGLTLYAIWDADESILSFSGNGATGGSVASITGVTEQSVTVPPNGFTRPGYTFIAWNTQDDGLGLSYQPGESLTLPVTGLTLYAEWEANAEVAITYSANGTGVTGTTASTVVQAGQDATVADNGYSRIGYEFTGWNTQADGQGDAYQPGEVVLALATELPLYAQWNAVESVVSFDANGGAGTMSALTGLVTGVTVTLPQNEFTNAGYEFVGWNTRADGQGIGYQNGETITLPGGGLTLYAQWYTNELPPVIVTTSLPDATVGQSYLAQIVIATPENNAGLAVKFGERIEARASSTTCAVTAGSLPAGLTLDAASCLISGTPTKVEKPAFTVEASNRVGSDSREFTITVAAASTPTPTPTPTQTGTATPVPTASASASSSSSSSASASSSASSSSSGKKGLAKTGGVSLPLLAVAAALLAMGGAVALRHRRTN